MEKFYVTWDEVEKLVGKEDRYWAIDQVELGYSFFIHQK